MKSPFELYKLKADLKQGRETVARVSLSFPPARWGGGGVVVGRPACACIVLTTFIQNKSRNSGLFESEVRSG